MKQASPLVFFVFFRPFKRVGSSCAVCYNPCYNIRIRLLVLEHTGCSVCYNTRIKLLEHPSVVV